MDESSTDFARMFCICNNVIDRIYAYLCPAYVVIAFGSACVRVALSWLACRLRGVCHTPMAGSSSVVKGFLNGRENGGFTCDIVDHLQGSFGLFVRNSFAPYRGQNLQNREKRVSESKNPHFLPPRKGRPESKNPHVYIGHYRENGDSLTRNTFFVGWREMGVF